jgi:hypothetical protein
LLTGASPIAGTVAEFMPAQNSELIRSRGCPSDAAARRELGEGEVRIAPG